MSEKEWERMPVTAAANGDKNAIDDLVSACMPLIRSIAKRFYVSERYLSRDELIQSGVVGLLQALSGFKIDSGIRFTTYAFPWILGEMRKTVRRAVNQNSKTALQIQLDREEARMINRSGCSAALSEFASACGISEDEAALSLCCRFPEQRQTVSAFALVSSLPGGLNPEETLDLHTAIASLRKEERLLILLRYFKDMTQTETARLLGKSQTQISRLERRALDCLRKRLD